MAEAGVGVVPIRADTSGLAADIQRGAESAFASVGSRMQSIGKSMFRSGAVISAGVSAPIALAFKGAFDAASNLNESLSKTRAVFGEASPAVEAFAQHAAENIGLSEQAALDAAGSFGNMFVQLGIGSDQAAAMSQQMGLLAADFASFHNADIADVIDAQSAAFRGEYDALQRYVPTINAAAVEQEALRRTGKKTTKELTAQEKALAVQALMMQGAGDAVGDFARTSGGAANKQRILRAQFEDTAATVGQQLLPIALKLLGWVQSAVEWFSNLGQPMQGIILAGAGLLAVVGPLVTVVGALVTVVGVLLSPVALVIAAIAALAVGVFLAYQKFEGFRDVVDGVARWFATTIPPLVQTVTDGIVEQFRNLVDWTKTHWGEIREAISHVFTAIATIVAFYIGIIKTAWSMFGDDLLRYAKTIWGFIRDSIKNAIDMIRSIIETVLALINGDWGKAWEGIKGIASAVWEQIKDVVNLGIAGLRFLLGAGLSLAGAAWSTAWDGFTTAVDAVWETIKDIVRKAVGYVLDQIDRMLGPIDETLAKVGKLGGGFIGGALGAVVPGAGVIKDFFADGVTNYRGGLAVVGERGPEVVELPRGSNVIANHDLASRGLDPDELGKQVAKAVFRVLQTDIRAA